MPDTWIKSTRSMDSDSCVEVSPVWVKSTRSSNNGSCVEVDIVSEPGTIRMRDSKLGDASPILDFNPKEWEAFLGGVKDGEFDF